MLTGGMTMHRTALVLFVAGWLVAGCASKPATDKAARASPARRDARVVPVQARLEVYVIALPEGTVSRNEAFWRRVDEQVVDPGAYDVLSKNGIRIGTAAIGEWDYFKTILEQYPASHQRSEYVTARGQSVQLPIRSEQALQTVFHLDRSGVLHGRTYDQCQNHWAMTLYPTPGKADAVRVGLSPVVRSQRQRAEVSRSGESMDVAYILDERVYDDLGLTVDVAEGSFLVLAPSEQASWPNSIGNRFLLSEDAKLGRMENVILVVPQAPGGR
jgi:hypothetical protein